MRPFCFWLNIYVVKIGYEIQENALDGLHRQQRAILSTAVPRRKVTLKQSVFTQPTATRIVSYLEVGYKNLAELTGNTELVKITIADIKKNHGNEA